MVPRIVDVVVPREQDSVFPTEHSVNFLPFKESVASLGDDFAYFLPAGLDNDSEWEFSSYFQFVDQPSEEELAHWWTQPLNIDEILAGVHVEHKFFPGVREGYVGSRGWRRDSLLRLLQAWHQLCTRLGILYWLDGGSLLGRHRSNGTSLIPWDIDVDVGMMRDEFRRLNATLNEASRRGVLTSGDLGLPDDMLLTAQTSPPNGSRYTERSNLIPGRLIDKRTGFYVDVFGDFFLRGDGDIQMLWPYSGSHSCSDNDTVVEPPVCQRPCAGSVWCYVYKKEDLLPPVPCPLRGAGELYCPRAERRYLEVEYTFLSPDHFWSKDIQDFI